MDNFCIDTPLCLKKIKFKHQVHQRPVEWITFDCIFLNIDEIDNQYLSNIYWYHAIFNKILNSWILPELENRGITLLPYSPRIDFLYEINKLHQQGFLVYDRNAKYTSIMYNSHLIGIVKLHCTKIFGAKFGI